MSTTAQAAAPLTEVKYASYTGSTGRHGSIVVVMPQQVPTVTVPELPAVLPEGVTLLDVREPDEWAAGHAPEAVHIPMGDIAASLGALPADNEVYVVCRSGGRSARVTAYLNANGWDAKNVDGGMQSWQAAGRRLTSDAGEPTVL